MKSVLVRTLTITALSLGLHLIQENCASADFFWGDGNTTFVPVSTFTPTAFSAGASSVGSLSLPRFYDTSTSPPVEQSAEGYKSILSSTIGEGTLTIPRFADSTGPTFYNGGYWVQPTYTSYQDRDGSSLSPVVNAWGQPLENQKPQEDVADLACDKGCYAY